MTRLLVSVRSVDEALLAAETGVDLIDVKEPARGPLGVADASIRCEIGQRLGTNHLLSAACGELRDFEARSISEGNNLNAPGSAALDPASWTGYRFAKIGLAGCTKDSTWREKWLAWRSCLPAFVEPVLVSYADAESCGAPCYEELRAFAIEHRIGIMLFDTCDKHGPGLCKLWQTADFLRVSQELQHANILYVLAGKLGLENISALRQLGASYLGIRGAVCDSIVSGVDVRCGKMNPTKIKTWRQTLLTATIQTIDQPTSIGA